MISIGNHVRITEGVKILTHDYSWSVLKNYRGGVFGASGTVEIGDNVFMETVVVRPCHTYGPSITPTDNRANVQFISRNVLV